MKSVSLSLGVNDPYIIYLIPFERHRFRFSLSLGVNEPLKVTFSSLFHLTVNFVTILIWFSFYFPKNSAQVVMILYDLKTYRYSGG